MSRPVVVLGLMGAGKTTVARGIVGRTGRTLRDSDADIEADTGRTAHDVAADSVTELHRLEAAQLIAALDDPQAVVAAAASVVDEPDCRVAMGRAFVIWLSAPIEVLAARFSSGPHRPVYDADISRMLRDQMVHRGPELEKLADLVLDATRPPGALIDDAVAALAAVDASSR